VAAFENEFAPLKAAKLLTCDEARRIAANIRPAARDCAGV